MTHISYLPKYMIIFICCTLQRRWSLTSLATLLQVILLTTTTIFIGNGSMTSSTTMRCVHIQTDMNAVNTVCRIWMMRWSIDLFPLMTTVISYLHQTLMGLSHITLAKSTMAVKIYMINNNNSNLHTNLHSNLHTNRSLPNGHVVIVNHTQVETAHQRHWHMKKDMVDHVHQPNKVDTSAIHMMMSMNLPSKTDLIA